MAPAPNPPLPPAPAIPIDDRSAIADARRLVRLHAELAGLDPHRTEEAAIVVSELATNLLRHAQEGLIIVRSLTPPVEPRGIAIIAVDAGPGTDALDHAFEDGVSSSGTAGVGLGAIRRLSDTLLFHSFPGLGTALYAEIRASPGGASPGSFARHLGIALRQYPNADHCGDGYAVTGTRDHMVFALIDGLGHGAGAATATRVIADTLLAASPSADIGSLLADAHAAARRTRGAAIAVARYLAASGEIEFCGTGNITTAIVSPGAKPRHLVSTEGTIGHAFHRTLPMRLPLGPDQRLLMASDGIKSGWTSADGAAAHHLPPPLQAARILLQHGRATDDASVLIFAPPPQSPAP